jgi:hypothetical protein
MISRTIGERSGFETIATEKSTCSASLSLRLFQGGYLAYLIHSGQRQWCCLQRTSDSGGRSSSHPKPTKTNVAAYDRCALRDLRIAENQPVITDDVAPTQSLLLPSPEIRKFGSS